MAEIRPFREDDLDSILCMTKAAWQGMTLYHLTEQRHGMIGKVPWHERKSRDVGSFCTRYPQQVLVADEDGRVVGYVTFAYEEADCIGMVGNNAVHPDFRGRGIGTALVTAAIEKLKTLGARVLRVTTLEHDAAARHIYEKCGFEEIARSIHYTMNGRTEP